MERDVSQRVIQSFIEKGIQGQTLEVQGDGEDKLDFTYIDDLVDGVCRIVNSNDRKNTTFNVTYGESRSINDVCKILKDLIPNINIEYKRER